MAKKTINVIYKVDDKELTKAKNTLSGVEKEAKDADKAVKDLGDEAKKSGNTAKDAFGGFGKVIAAVSLVALAKQVFDFGVKVANITAEFQKFEAVLTNTLGSRSQAQLALAQIKAFAESTPFSVQELTASFVKLANQGFKPTVVEMTKLGDLAAANGKTFDMLTEAIIDAQTGEFERLKEFGIRASKEGDKVTFAFKGVQTQPDFTADSIRNYILSLGDLEGVSGGMAAISETLGGKISNLGDSWDSLLVTIGEGNNGILSGAVALMADMVDNLKTLLKTRQQLRGEQQLSDVDAELDALKLSIESMGDLNLAVETHIKLLAEERDELFRKANADEGDGIATQKRIESVNAQIDAIEDYVFGLKDQEQKQKDAASAALKEKAAQEALTIAKKKATQAAKEQADLLSQIEKDSAAMDSKEIVVDSKDPFFINYGDAIEPDTDRALAAMKERDDALINQQAEANQRAIDLEKEKGEQIKNIRELIFNESLNLIAQLLLAEDNRINKAIESEQHYAEQQTLLAGDNERRKAEVKIESERRIEELNKQQAEKEKQQVIKRILIESALNAVKALGTPPVPNFVLAAITAGFGVAQAGIVRAQGFKDGVIDLQGPGTTKSDSINARLSKGESVITAEATASSRNLLEAIQDRKIDDSVLTKMAKGGVSQVNVFDDSRLIKAIKEGNSTTKREAYTLYETKQIGANLRIKTRSKIQGYK